VLQVGETYEFVFHVAPKNWAFWKIPEKCFPGGLKTFWQFGNFYAA
jgi:hypothetical protein